VIRRIIHGKFPRVLASALVVIGLAVAAPGAASAVSPTKTDLVAGAPGAKVAKSLPCTPSQELKNIRVHDPFVMPDPVSGIYYLYQGTTVRRSIDLVNWCPAVTVFTNPTGSWANTSEGAWAPEAWYYNGKYYWFATLHNRNRVLATASTQGQACGDCGQIWQNQQWRGTVIASADSPMGPFQLLNLDSPVAPSNFMTLDGTLYVDPQGQPWMVYAHEWIQKIDGTIEAIRLERDANGNLTGRGEGDPIYLFKGSDAPWYYQEGTVNAVQLPPYVTDGPSFFRTNNGELLMFWTSYRKHNNEYVVTLARSKSGDLKGPWAQEDVVITENKGHSMLFRTFADHPGAQGAIMMALHNNMNRGASIRTEIYEMKATGRTLDVARQRTDIDGNPASSWVWPIS